MAEKRFKTLHPEAGKQGVNINEEKYGIVRDAILETIREHGTITFQELTKEVNRKLEGHFDGSISWYVTTTKLDLEARGTIERLPGSKPQRIRLRS